MARRIIAGIGMFFVSLIAFSQGTERKVARPDLPGSFLIDFGYNSAVDGPANFDRGLIGSRTLNLYYQYPIRLGRSKFSFVPGAGFGFDRFKLSNKFTLANTKDVDGTFPLVDATAIYPNVKKSMLITNYFDFPVEFRFDSRPEDISRSFNVAIGARGGYLFDSGTKVKFTEDGEDKIVKDKQSHGLNSWRYGFYTRIGVGGFNWFLHYNLSSLFEEGKGPDKTEMSSFTIGISINGF